MPEFLNIELMNWEDFWDLILRCVFNTLVILYVVRILYYKTSKKKDYLFTYILISLVVFFMIMLLENIKVELGFALGLFAIFGMLRYRTLQIPIREMTYLFLVIGISLINALANRRVSYAELLFTNVTIVTVTYMLERVFLLKHESRRMIQYEKVDLIKPENRAELVRDLEERTGLKINRVEIGRIDYLRDSVRVYIHYFESENWGNLSEDAPLVSESSDDDD
jgi:hypothetical protein